MTYLEYFRQADFDEVWKTLHTVYGESEETRPLYKTVFEDVKGVEMESEEDLEHSNEKIEVSVTENGEVFVKGAPDPQEWLLGREIFLSTNLPTRWVGSSIERLISLIPTKSQTLMPVKW